MEEGKEHANNGTMISFDTFNRAILKIQEISIACDVFGNALRTLDKDNSNYFTMGWTEQTISDILSEAMDDKFGLISEFCYPGEFGKKGSIRTTKQLYKKILENK